jgi:hypothetical protein
MGELRREHGRRPENSLRRVFCAYRFEIIWLLIAVAGAILLFDRWQIHHLVTKWLEMTHSAVVGLLSAIDRSLAEFVAETSPAELVGFVLVVLALLALVMRVRWRMMHSQRLTTLSCPRCGGSIHRVHRRMPDRLLSLFLPSRRYRCGNSECRWQGLRVYGGHRSHKSRRS